MSSGMDAAVLNKDICWTEQMGRMVCISIYVRMLVYFTELSAERNSGRTSAGHM